MQKELAEERRAIRDFVEGDPLLSRFFRVFLFEDLPAADRRADEVYLAEVDRAEACILLLGDEYGFQDAAGVSPTEREFDRAAKQGIPRFVFVKGADDKRRHAKMAALVRKAGAQLIRRRFQNVAELTSGVYASLVDHLERTGVLRTRPLDASACLDAKMEDLAGEKLRWFLDRARTCLRTLAQHGFAKRPRARSLHRRIHAVHVVVVVEPFEERFDLRAIRRRQL